MTQRPMKWTALMDHRKKYDRSPKMVDYEDKIKSKEIAKSYGCPVPETYFVTDNANKIPFDKLPARYVLKPTHYASALGVFLMNNGVNTFTGKRTSPAEMIRVSQKYLSMHIAPHLNEWATSKIPRRIIVEEYLPDMNGNYTIPMDYKCFTFHGKVCMVRVDYDRLLPTQSNDYYNRDFELITFDNIKSKYKRRNYRGPKPMHWDTMIDFAERIGKDYGDFIRVDMYITPTGPVFGENTTYPGSGRLSKDMVSTDKIDRYMGALWQHPELVLNVGEKPFTIEHFNKVLANLMPSPIPITIKPSMTSNKVCQKCHKIHV